MNMEDLLSIGTIGFIKAVNTFHPERGSRLGDICGEMYRE